jgi:hypothetical protein
MQIKLLDHLFEWVWNYNMYNTVEHIIIIIIVLLWNAPF